MTTIHVQYIGDKALVSRSELARLIELAQYSEQVQIDQQEDLPTLRIMGLVEQGGAFDFWQEEGENIYSVEDGEPV